MISVALIILWRVSELFPAGTAFLLLADFSQENIYELDPHTGDMRAVLTMTGSSPSAIAFNNQLNIIYWTSFENVADTQLSQRGLDRHPNRCVLLAECPLPL